MRLRRSKRPKPTLVITVEVFVPITREQRSRLAHGVSSAYHVWSAAEWPGGHRGEPNTKAIISDVVPGEPS